MARFSAVASDSSSDEEDLKNDEQEIVSSSSEDERRPAARGSKLSAIDEDDEDYEEASSEESDTDETESSSGSYSDEESGSSSAMVEDELVRLTPSQDEARRGARDLRSGSRPVDTSVIPRAQRVGVDARKMHVMQSSLFRMPEEAAAMKAAVAVTQTKPKSRTRLTLTRKHSRDSDGDTHMTARERTSFEQDIEPPVYRPSRKYAKVPTPSVKIDDRENIIADAGFAFGRSFRAGWGPNGTLVHFGKICSPFATSDDRSLASVISLSKVQATPDDENTKEFLGNLLQHHLSNTPIGLDDDRVPFASPLPSLTFSSFLKLFTSSPGSHTAQVFELGRDLFDSLPYPVPQAIPPLVRDRLTLVARKTTFSSWLESAVSSSLTAKNTSQSVPTSIFTLLTGNQIEKAMHLASENGYAKLASLISLAGGDEQYRQDLEDQLVIWSSQKVDEHISNDIRKIYALLSGSLEAKGVDVYEGLDWKRAFGLHLWFRAPIEAPLSDVIRSYEDVLSQEEQPHVAKPLPPKALSNPSAPLQPLQPQASATIFQHPSPSQPLDVLYSLIKLYADPTLSLSDVLFPESFDVSSSLDFSLCWHLYILLSRTMRIRDFPDRDRPSLEPSEDDESDIEVEGHSPRADLLANSYAYQLEQCGMIQEAAFVLLHIEGSAGRKKAIKDLLARNAEKLDPWMSRGLLGSLHIPSAWVEEAKATHALSTGDIFNAYEHYCVAGLWNTAHDLAVLELAPDAIMRNDLMLVESLVIKFQGKSVDGWHVRGKAYLDFVNVVTRLPELHANVSDPDVVPDAAEAIEMDELIRSVPRLIGLLPDVLRDHRTDVRHAATLARMIGMLMKVVDKVKPAVLAQSQIRPTLVDEGARLRHIKSTAYERFMKTIQVA